MSDVRALLLTDIVDSTATAGLLGDEASAALGAAHDRVARDLLQAWRGREIDKTDGMLMLFDTAADAVGYAVTYHRALTTLTPPVRARAGLHVGPVILRASPPEDVAQGAKSLEVEGVAKPIAARVMSLAQAGQTLVTAAAREVMGPTPFRVQSHGYWRMKGVADPIELFEIGDAGAPFTPPPDGPKVYRVVKHDELWLPARQLKHNLPAERDAFVGRRESLDALARRFDSGVRLVSVLGIGGSGKTRLAVRFAWTWLGEFPGGAWFCDLTQARGFDGVVHAVAQGLGVPLGKDDPVVQLGHAIAGRGPCLVILDNFEQVSRHAAATLGRWLDYAGQARFLVTSREVLGLTGEEPQVLAPLTAPDAATLFAQRAASAKRDFLPTTEDLAAIPRLVTLLDGLPLAIELAAARVRVMPPSALLARMDQRFKLLKVSGARRDRHATLRATFDWSWELLTPGEKAALAQLSVFEGGFTLESAEAVLDLSASGDEQWIVDVLQSLVDKSFVRALPGARFVLLSSVQEYAAEHLRTPGRYPGSGAEALASTEARHGAFFVAMDPRVATANGCVEVDNLVTACRRSATNGRAAVAVPTLELAWAALELHGPFRVGVELAAIVGSVSGLKELDLARVHLVAGCAEQASGHLARARPYFESALILAGEAGDVAIEGQAHGRLGDLHASEGRLDESRMHLDAALTVARSIGRWTLESQVLSALGGLCIDAGRTEEARSHYHEALRSARLARDRRWEGGVLGNLGSLNAGLGLMDEARANYEAALVAAREVGDLKFEGNALSNLGLLNHLAGRIAEARAHLEASLGVAREIGHRRLQCIVLCNLGIVLDVQGQTDEAREHFEQALAVARELADRLSEGQFLGYLGLSHARQQRFDDAHRCLAAGEALLQQASDPSSLALLLCARAEAEHLAGKPHIALQAVDRARKLARSAGAGPESELGIALARVARIVEPSGSPRDRATAATDA